MRFQIGKILAILSLFYCRCISSLEVDHPLTIPEAIEISLEKDPATKESWYRAKRAAAAFGVVKSDLYPTVSANMLYAQGRDYEFINGPNKTYREASASFILNYLMLDFGRTNLAVKAAKDALIAACWENEYQIQEVISNTLIAVYAFYEAIDQKNSQEKAVEDASLMVETAEDKFQAGLASENDLLTSKARLAEQKALLSKQIAREEIARGYLARALGISYFPELTMVDLQEPDIDEIEENKLGLNALLELAEFHRKDFQAQWAKLNEKQNLEKKSSRSGLPSLNLRADCGLQTYFDKRRSHKGDYNIALSFNSPLFTGFKISSERKLAMADLQIEWQKTIGLHQDAALEILTFLEELKSAKSVYKLSLESLYYSEKAYNGTLDKYKVGAASIYDLVDSQTMLFRARVHKNEAKSKLYRSIAELAFSIGLSPNIFSKDLCP